MVERIDHIEITTGNLEKTISFYTDILGFKIKERNQMDRPPLEEIDYLTLGDTMIEVSQLDTAALTRIVEEGLWDKELVDQVTKYGRIEETSAVYLSKLKEEE